MIDNIFISKFRNENCSVCSLINGLSERDAEELSLFNIIVLDNRNEFYCYRDICKHSLNEFETSLGHEAWENVFRNTDNDTNTIFNNFLILSSGNFVLVFL